MLGEGDRFPGFQLPDLTGKTHRLAEFNSGGRVLCVVYKASCPVCQQTMPYLDRVARNGQLAVVGIAQETPKSAERFNRELKIHSVVTLVEGNGYPLSNQLGVTSVPSLFLVNGDGKIERSWTGFSKADMELLETYAGAPVFTLEEASKVPLFRPG